MDETGKTDGSGAPQGARVVLLVDDETDILVSLRRFIQKSLPNTLVLTAESGDDALKILAKESVDVIVSDYKMPGMDGLSFLNEARKRAPEIPRILVTAFPDLDVAMRAINQARIHNFFTKPFDVVAIIEGIKAALNERSSNPPDATAASRGAESFRRRLHARG